MVNSVMRLAAKLVLISALLLISTIQPAMSIKVLDYYSFQLRGDLPTHIAVESQERIWLSLPSRMEVVLFMPKTGEMIAVSLPGLPSKILYYEGVVIVALSNAKSVAVIDPNTFEVKTFEFRANVVDMYPTKNGIWLTLPDIPQVVLFSPSEMRVLKELNLNVATGEGIIAESDSGLWVIEKSYRSLILVDTLSGSIKTYEVGNQTYLVAPAKDGGVWAVTVEGYLIRITRDLKLVEKVALPAGTVVAPPLLSTDYGSVVYFCRPRNSAGEVFDGNVEEIRMGLASPWHPTKGPNNTFWFIDITKNAIGVVTISKPPTIKVAGVEKLTDKDFRVFAEVEDREGDLMHVMAVVEQYVGGKLIMNSTFEMGLVQGNRYAGDESIGIDNGIAMVKVVASDVVGNVVYFRAGNITIKDGVITNIELKKGEEQGTGIQIYILISELLLLIPVVLAVFYVIRRRKKSHKRK
jgi:streptogramin lyase